MAGWRTAPMIISALLGVAILTGATQVSSHVRTEPMPGRSLVLTGVIAYTDPLQGFAIIGSSVRNTYLVRPGQRLPDGSWIREIHPHHVVLEHGSSLETVGMYERGQPAGSGYTQMPSPPQQLRWDETQLGRLAGGETTADQVRPTEAQPVNPRLGDTRPNETPPHELRPKDTPPSDAPPYGAAEASATGSPLPRSTGSGG